MAIRRMDDPPTTFIVSQRAASVRYADEILVLDDGVLAGKGTHDELLESCPVYQEIYYSQFPKEAVQMANQMAILRVVLRRIRRYWVGLVASLLLATLYVVMSLYTPFWWEMPLTALSMPDGWIYRHVGLSAQR